MPDNKYLEELLSKHEGDKESVYTDSAGIPTIGKGLNLRGPAARTAFQGMGVNPDDVISGQVQPTKEQLDEAYKYTLGQKAKDFNNYLQQHSSGLPLTAQKEAALRSLHYNSPALLGPSLSEKLSKGDEVGVTKEILLRSNKDKAPGVLKRRLDEAQMFAQENFPQYIDSLSTEELLELQQIMDKLPDSAEKRQLLTQHQFLNKDYKPQKLFSNIKRMIAGDANADKKR